MKIRATSTWAAVSIAIFWAALGVTYFELDRLGLSARATAFSEHAIEGMFILSLTWIAVRVADAWLATFGRRTEHRLFSVSLYSTIVQVAILALGLLTLLGSMNVAVAPLLTTLGLGGLAVALALNDTLSNLFAGVQIISAGQLRVGDYVRFDFAEGEVVDITWHNTTIRDLQNNLIVVPNNKINTSVMTNYSLRDGKLVVPVTATLPWKASWEQLRGIAQRASGGAPVWLSALNETNVQLTALLPVERATDRPAQSAGFLERLLHEVRAAQEELATEPGTG